MGNENSFVWINGEIKPIQNASVHILSHSLHYGSAVFEGIRVYETHDGKSAIFRAKEHYDRLLRSLSALKLKCAFDSKALIQATKELVKKNNLKSCYVRPLGFVDQRLKGLKLPQGTEANVMIATWEWGKYLGEESAQKGIRVCVSSFRRPDPSSSLPWAKISGNYVNSILARQEATQGGYDEALLLDTRGFIAEGSGENIFVIRSNKIFTPSKASILPGITRDTVITFFKDLSMEVIEKDITRNEIYEADEVFFTGTAAEITPIREVDGYLIGQAKGPGEWTQKILKMFEDTVRGRSQKHADWLEIV